MRHVCQCGQAVTLPDRPGKFACPKCRQPLPSVQAAPVQPAPFVQPAPVKDWKKLGSWIGGGIVLLVVLFAIFRGKEREAKKEEKRREATTTEASVKKPSDNKVHQASEIYNAFLDDKEEARKTYSDKRLYVKFHLRDISRSGKGIKVTCSGLDWRTNEMNGQAFELFFSLKDSEALNELREYDSFDMEGTCRGKFLGTINFIDCKRVK